LLSVGVNIAFSFSSLSSVVSFAQLFLHVFILIVLDWLNISYICITAFNASL